MTEIPCVVFNQIRQNQLRNQTPYLVMNVSSNDAFDSVVPRQLAQRLRTKGHEPPRENPTPVPSKNKRLRKTRWVSGQLHTRPAKFGSPRRLVNRVGWYPSNRVGWYSSNRVGWCLHNSLDPRPRCCSGASRCPTPACPASAKKGA